MKTMKNIGTLSLTFIRLDDNSDATIEPDGQLEVDDATAEFLLAYDYNSDDGDIHFVEVV